MPSYWMRNASLVGPVATGSTAGIRDLTYSQLNPAAPPQVVFATASAQGFGSVQTNTMPFTVPAGSNRLLLAWINTTQYGQITRLTFQGTSLTRFNGLTSTPFRECWYLINPPVVTNGTLAFTFGVSNNYTEIALLVFTGVHQTTPLSGYQTATGSGTGTATVTIASAANQLVTDSLVYWQNTVAAGAGQTQQWTATSDGSWSAKGSTKAGTLSTPMTWTITNGVEWGLQAVSVLPA